MTPHAWTETAGEEDDSPAIRSYFQRLLDWSPGPEDEARPGDEVRDETAREETTPKPGSDDSDDDDLEMFRSWLESLKQ